VDEIEQICKPSLKPKAAKKGKNDEGEAPVSLDEGSDQ